ncbi:zinc finger MYM-type protein 1-like [Poecilia latipinna]|uniref:zinc finger MYM-type protein 1-like n=1 Tax=Poecilia latipinna TaxID=48699 RepID=UPI00072ECFF4|nr:PREDICTED: zinc finger MYM-type protein 1-like [Poecilia latipinna]
MGLRMSGAYSGVQARITEKEPLACYVHCTAHNLNLALNDSVKNVPGVKRFYDTVENLYNFFGHSIKREVCTALILFLTLPVSVASSEHSFSKLKTIKNHLRSTMGQERLSGLAILSIENERAKKMDIQSIMDDFAERKVRRMPFK